MRGTYWLENPILIGNLVHISLLHIGLKQSIIYIYNNIYLKYKFKFNFLSLNVNNVNLNIIIDKWINIIHTSHI